MKKAYKDLAEIAQEAPEAKEELRRLWNQLAETCVRHPGNKGKAMEVMRSQEYKDAAKVFTK